MTKEKIQKLLEENIFKDIQTVEDAEEYKLIFTKVNQLLEEMKPNAEKKIKTRLVLEAVVDAEKIEVSAEELEAEYKKLADMYQMEVDKVKEIMGTAGEENMKKDIAVQKAVDVIADSAK